MTAARKDPLSQLGGLGVWQLHTDFLQLHSHLQLKNYDLAVWVTIQDARDAVHVRLLMEKDF